MGILNKKGLLHFILKEMELIILPQNFFFVLFNLFFQIYLSLESLIEFFIFLKHFFKRYVIQRIQNYISILSLALLFKLHLG